MKGLAILLWSATPERPDRCAAPFVHAMAAAALDCEVEIHFSGAAVALLIAGAAAEAHTAAGKPLYAFMQEAAALGVRFYACSMAARQHLPPDAALVPEFTGHAGATAFVARTLDPEWRTLVF
ncbi:DsrE family protein [Denitratisoma sp. DHT3]|uniref:DsrE family protein n=1 Tax=Denitratisoma sp. DHT3 TaxID=1981880 RepID=UPI0016470734|nr:DsrE family protein [Denitratisoma sp. DHT3]